MKINVVLEKQDMKKLLKEANKQNIDLEELVSRRLPKTTAHKHNKVKIKWI